MPNDIHPSEYADMQAQYDVAVLGLKIRTTLFVGAVLASVGAVAYGYFISDHDLMAWVAIFGTFACLWLGKLALRSFFSVQAQRKIEGFYRKRDAAGKSDKLIKAIVFVGFGIFLFFASWRFLGWPTWAELQDPQAFQSLLKFAAMVLAIYALAAFMIFRRPAPEIADPALSDQELMAQAEARRTTTRRKLIWINVACFAGILAMYLIVLVIGT